MSIIVRSFCPSSQTGWWAIMGAKANHTYAMAQLLRTPSPVEDDSERTTDSEHRRKRDKLKAIFMWRRLAVLTEGSMSGEPEQASGPQETYGSEGDATVIRTPLSNDKAAIEDKDACYKVPFNYGPGLSTTEVHTLTAQRV